MSDIRVDTISAADGTSPVALTKQSAAKAWINFNGTGTVAIRESSGVASITDTGVGSTNINFTSAFISAGYAFASTTYSYTCSIDPISATSAFSRCYYVNGLGGNTQALDIAQIGNIYHGDLA